MNSRQQNMLREKALYRYINALERGNIDIIEAILQEAEQDDILERMITDVHRSYRLEEDAATYASNVAFVRQLLEQHRESEHAAVQFVLSSEERRKEDNKASSILTQENVLLSNPKVAKTTLFSRLKEIGLDKNFVMQRLLPQSLAVSLQGQKITEGTTVLVQQAAAIVERVLNWEPGTLFRPAPLQLNMEAVGTTRFKKNVRGDIQRVSAYTIYARYLALLVLKATAGLSTKPIPTEPDVVRREVLAAYGTFTFEHVLQYVWSLGIPVLPLNDRGIFHGACWRIDHRNAIVLKQRTMSDARWLFVLLHEFRHAGQDPDREQFEVIEASDISEYRQQAEEEKTASRFAGNVILDGRAEELAQMCVQAANGSVELLKSAVPIVAQREHVATDALANYMAFRLSLQKLDWWGTANNLQERSTAAWRITRDLLLRQANVEVLDEIDRNLLLQALSSSEV